jgi:hypothetical protein
VLCVCGCVCVYVCACVWSAGLPHILPLGRYIRMVRGFVGADGAKVCIDTDTDA